MGGGDQGGVTFSSGFRHPNQPKGPSFGIISWHPFRQTNPKVFLKAPLAQYILTLKGSAPRKTQFFGQQFPKSARKWQL